MPNSNPTSPAVSPEIGKANQNEIPALTNTAAVYAADAHERRLSQRNLPGVTEQNVQADDGDDADANEIEQTNHIAAEKKRRGEQREHKRNRHPPLPAIAHDRHVVRVRGVEITRQSNCHVAPVVSPQMSVVGNQSSDFSDRWLLITDICLDSFDPLQPKQTIGAEPQHDEHKHVRRNLGEVQ